jgi:hypothetical protein
MFVCVVVLLCTFSVSRFLLDLTGPSLLEIRPPVLEIRPSVLEIRPPIPEIRFPVFAVRIRQLDEGWWMRGRHFFGMRELKNVFFLQKFLFSSKNFVSGVSRVSQTGSDKRKRKNHQLKKIIFGNFF